MMSSNSDNEVATVSVSDLLSILDLDLSRLHIERDTGEILNYEFDIDANEFIKFAEVDLAQSDVHGLVNALTNAKRAIDSQVDKVLGCFGLLSRRNFPQKMEVLRKMGIVAPRIVNKVVKARNYLEHEFIAPDQEQVEDALDIATLFVISLDRALHFFPSHYEIGTIVDGIYYNILDPVSGKSIPHDYFMDKTLSIEYNNADTKFLLTGYIHQTPISALKRERKEIGNSVILPKDKGFLELVKLSLGIEKNLDDLETESIDFLGLFT